MTTLAQSLGTIRKPWQWMTIGAGVLLLCGLFALPRYNTDVRDARLAATEYQSTASFRSAAVPVAGLTESVALKSIASVPQSSAAVDRKIIRTTSMSLIVQHPAEITQQIASLADALGGYLVSSESGGESSATLTIRVPANRFDEARSQVRKLGLRVESEKVDAQDVTTQYVDQDASLRNLRAEEAGYLDILKQAHTVKDMLAVTEQLSNVRGQIEQQQAEFNTLSKQVETVAISISLRAESETQVFGLNWRPLYQIKLALRDGLDAVGNYATAMISILFYLPSVILWLGTIFIAGFGSWRLVRWAGRRWFGWKATPAAVQS
jgi:ElaB/YqjD/DUF883 family membrane-anchored ribosome-binding protein